MLADHRDVQAMMSAPYRGTSPADDVDSEAREVEQFAREMHAGRRVWSNENFGTAIMAALLGSTYLFLGAGLPLLTGRFESATLLFLAPALVWLASAALRFVRWRRAVRGA